MHHVNFIPDATIGHPWEKIPIFYQSTADNPLLPGVLTMTALSGIPRYFAQRLSRLRPAARPEKLSTP
jgi:hypothetical protein